MDNDLDVEQKKGHRFINSTDISSFQFKLLQISSSLLLFLTLPILMITLFKHFYYGDPWIAIFSFRSDDMPGLATVDPDKQVFGIHYFGDYLLASYWSELSNPWLDSDKVNYPPLAILFFRIFLGLDYRWGLVLFQSMMFLAMVAPIWMSLKNRALVLRLFAVIVFGTLSAPIIIAIDRGNVVGYLGILLYLFAISVLQKKWYVAAIIASVAIGIKLFPIAILSVFLIYRKWKALLVALVSTFVVVVAALAVFPGDFRETITGFWTGFSMFRNVDANLLYCGNQTLTGGLLSLLDLSGFEYLSKYLVENPLIVGALSALVLFKLMIKFKSEIWLVLVIAFSALTAVPALVFSYTMIWALPSLAVLFWASEKAFVPSKAISNDDEGQYCRSKVFISTAIYLTILLVPYPFQWHHTIDLLCTSSIYHVVYFTATAIWAIYLLRLKLKPNGSITLESLRNH